MARILTVGIATIDIINQVEHYPAEDAEIRAASQQIKRGGNATNTAVVLSQLDHAVDWAGVLINERDSQIIWHDLEQYQINTQYCRQLSTGKMPTSYVTVSEACGSRTIVHYRDCPEFSFADFQKVDLSVYDWVHFEGRNITETLKMLQHMRQAVPQVKCSIEIEKPRPDIEMLFTQADYLMFSHHYARHHQFTNAAQLLNSLPDSLSATCSWGDLGVWYKHQSALLHLPAFQPAEVVDTLGAGDTLNAGLIHGLVQQWPEPKMLEFAVQLAGLKCSQVGFYGLNRMINQNSSI